MSFEEMMLKNTTIDLNKLQTLLTLSGYTIASNTNDRTSNFDRQLRRFRNDCNSYKECHSGNRLNLLAPPNVCDIKALDRLTAPLRKNVAPLTIMSDFRELQHNLNRLGHILKEDGELGKATLDELDKFRKYYNSFNAEKLPLIEPYNEDDRNAINRLIQLGLFSSQDRINRDGTPIASYGTVVAKRNDSYLGNCVSSKSECDRYLSVKRIQRKLSSLGYSLREDGDYGPKLSKAILAFVNDYNKFTKENKNGFYGLTTDGFSVTVEMEAAMDDMLVSRGITPDFRTAKYKENYNYLLNEHSKQMGTVYNIFMRLFDL